MARPYTEYTVDPDLAPNISNVCDILPGYLQITSYSDLQCWTWPNP
jgi:hypothetical protein